MGFCDNIANRSNGIAMCLLCACWSAYYWFLFDGGVATGISGNAAVGSCNNEEAIKDNSICHMHCAAGVLTVIGGLIALGGICFEDTQNSQGSMAAAFTFLNLAIGGWYVAYWLEMDCDGDGLPNVSDDPCDVYIAVGVLHLAGCLSGAMYVFRVCVGKCCHCEAVGNNFFYVLAIILYMLANAVRLWDFYENADCSTDIDDIKEMISAEDSKVFDQWGGSDYCVALVFAGSFITIALALCLMGLIMSFWQDRWKQGRLQQFMIAFSVGMALLMWTCLYWYMYGSGYKDCNQDDPTDNSTSYCVTMVVGGSFSIVGFPISLFTSFAFLCGCYTEEGKYKGWGQPEDYRV